MAEAMQQLLEDSLGAIERGDARGVRLRLEALIAAGNQNDSLYLVLAHACKAMGDRAATEDAVDRALQLDPGNPNALMMKGDLLMSRNDMPAAAGYFDYLIKLAESAGFPADWQPLVDYARRCQSHCSEVLSGHLQRHLDVQGYRANQAPDRFNQALDLLTGKRRIFHQAPRAFYYPELPQIQFYPREMFPWVHALEDASDEIAWELQTVLTEQEQVFEPYLRADLRLAGTDPQKLRRNEGWRAFHLLRDGEVVIENAIRFPRTLAALERVPLTRIRNRAPSILFSMLKPGARILPHTGFINTRLICHLPLVVPQNCGLRVGNETRQWEPGKLLIFDDTIEHEAWNLSDQTRVVMIFDIWKPELSEQERVLVTSLLEGVDSMSASASRWDQG